MRVVISALILCCAVMNAFGRPFELLDEKHVSKRNDPEKDSILVMRDEGIHSSERGDESYVKEPEEDEEEDEEESPRGDKASSGEEDQSENHEAADNATDTDNDHDKNEHDDEDDNDDDDNDDDDDDDEDED